MPSDYCLIEEDWLPVRRRVSGPCTIRPAQITEHIATDPVIAIAWPRPDFRFATLEFLIGLLATACPPAETPEWAEAWATPPDPATLDTAFALLREAFLLDGPGPRFMQDLEDFAGEPNTAEALLIDSPGDAGLRKNTDLLVKRGRVARLSRAGAAMALFTLQTYAPSGGRGNRAGLRGGGPLTTLIAPDPPHDTLWHLLWANVPRGKPATAADFPRIFPWLAPTRTSENDRAVQPQDGDPLQAFWSMPRRIRLDFADAEAAFACDLTGSADSVAVTGWRQRPYGPKYENWPERHPLSPRYSAKPGEPQLAVHPQPDGIGYRHWVGLVQAEQDARMPAHTVREFRQQRRDEIDCERVRLLAGGYDMDNMKARGFVESEMPLHLPANAAARGKLDELSRALVTAANVAAGLTRFAVLNALFASSARPDAASTLGAGVRAAVYEATETAFFNAMADGASLLSADAAASMQQMHAAWLATLRRAGIVAFDQAVPPDPDMDVVKAKRVVEARRLLLSAFAGFGTFGKQLHEALGLPLPESGKPARKTAKKKAT